jgi:5'-phosphate synthase pdxT subunit
LHETAIPPHIGVLAIQGDYERHATALEESGALPSLVKTPEALESLDGLVLPGGESTTMLRFLNRGNARNSFFDVLKSFAQKKPVFGTCAGAILLAREVLNPAQSSLAILDIAVERNAYGVHRDSAILTLETKIPGGPLETVFIRAPRIVSAGPEVEILAKRDGFPILIRQGHTMAATFHPELSDDRRVHRLFVNLVNHAKN